ncbi:uncharacterized protein BDR25DRAFT_364554 [Lindgomyces ingoldianus]|uniref:Uncharacterized protein n=1 Tax=Lindgomyces ingoldianus TaxID=673940 RepID=A0ACB6REC5_9PLEO|nr:uncharacterized protein BDR25DRAFT_364554 [Lindgomyces ingoldianus]KAF2477663.1 hypothetical protein BDR25DRAFT_364554 [Lindgomyces ingoldianus]
MASTQPSPILCLPAEIRLSILEHTLPKPLHIVFRPPTHTSGFSSSNPNNPRGLSLDENYSSSSHLSLLLTCHQFRSDFTHLLFSSTQFVVTDTYTPLPRRLEVLRQCQIEAIRHIAFVASARQFRDLVHWTQHPFNLPNLKLDTLAVVLHRSAHWHYPSDFTADMVSLLRRLQNVRSLYFIRNGANVKGFFKTWYNRLVGLVLKEDHWQRYDNPQGPCLEEVWWEWEFDAGGQWFKFKARKPRRVVGEEAYLEGVKGLVEGLMREMEGEEEDPDPRARNGWA